MNHYAQGGQAQGIKSLAKELPKYGRYGDTIVAHINPQEAALLKAMGGSGTINPVTGLPEFFVKKAFKAITKPVEDIAKGVEKAVIRPIGDVVKPILPYVQYVAPFIPGIGTAAAVGLGALSSGFAGGGGFNLKRGLMGGITAYGMSNLAQGLQAAAGPGAGTTSGVPAIGVDDAGVALLPADAAATAGVGATSVPPITLDDAGQALLPADRAAMAEGVATFGDKASAMASNIGQGIKDVGSSISNQASTYGQGIKNLTGLGDTTMGIKDAAKVFGKEFGMGSAGAVLMGTSGQAAIDEAQKMKDQADLAAAKSDEERNAILARIEEGRRRAEEAVRSRPYMFAYGGSVDDEAGTDDVSSMGLASMAKGGMTPRFLSGGGDGMSDDIPATINNRQPARLADGEFVIPADVVSHLGNGSSKAGAKRLYSMMDRVRKARTGTTKQGREINPAKYMPA